MTTPLDLLTNEDKIIIRNIQKLSTENILKTQDDKGTPYLNHIYRLHRILFSEVCSACPSQLKLYINRIKEINMKVVKEKKDDRKFKMKPGKVIHILGTSKVYSEHNITDEIAIKLLKENPNRAQLFSKLHSNWTALVKEAEKKNVEIEK